MKVERISRLKGAVLVFVMLTFAVVVMLEGVVAGDEQNNVEEPVLEISKTMISGETTVPIKTKVYWELEIKVTNNGDTELTDVVVKDTLPAELELVGTTVSQGVVTVKAKKGSTKITWTVGTVLAGATETLVMEIATKTKTGKGRKIQYFNEPGEYSLNKGVTVTAVDPTLITAEGTGDMGMITAGPTDEIIVYAEQKRMGRMGGGMGGGRWR